MTKIEKQQQIRTMTNNELSAFAHILHLQTNAMMLIGDRSDRVETLIIVRQEINERQAA